MNNTEVTNPKLVFFIVISLVALAAIGLSSTVFMILKGLPVSSIAIVSTITGTIIGNLAAMLTNTRATPTVIEPTVPKL
jgi:hypothetical protein